MTVGELIKQITDGDFDLSELATVPTSDLKLEFNTSSELGLEILSIYVSDGGESLMIDVGE